MSEININQFSESINDKADRDLGNLESPEGENHFTNLSLNNTPYTTNRILEIPQDIKLELNNDTLTLKAGSKICRPNGFEADGTTPKFDFYILENDITDTSSGHNQSELLTLRFDGSNPPWLFWFPITGCYSGSSAPTGFSTYAYWYDITTNKMRWTGNSGSSWSTVAHSFPIAVGTTNSSGATVSINQIFNGFGYIGSTVFMLPNVEVQNVYGRNENGTYINYVRKNNTVKILTRTSIALTDWMIVCSVFDGEMRDIYYVRNFKIVEKVPTSETSYTVLFNEVDGSFYYTNAGTTPVKINYLVIPLVKNISCDSNGKVTSFTPCDVNTVNTYSRSELSGFGMPSSKYEDWMLGASYATYTAPANGSFFVRKVSSALGQYLAVYYRDSANNPIGRNEWSSAANQTLTCMLTVQKGTVVHIDYNAGGATSLFQFIYAEGEV